jgi:hypothetical protein
MQGPVISRSAVKSEQMLIDMLAASKGSVEYDAS